MPGLATGGVVPVGPLPQLFRKACEHNILLAVFWSSSECMPDIYMLRRGGHHVGAC